MNETMNKQTNYLTTSAFFFLTIQATTAQSIKNEVQILEGAKAVPFIGETVPKITNIKDR
jgi:hypothetical protein